VRGRPQWHVRSAETADLPAAARLLHDFNAEFDDLTPAPTEIAARLEVLIAAGDTVVLVGGAGPDGLAVLRLRPNLWTPRLECYLAEFYVRPPLRGGGFFDAAGLRTPGTGVPTMVDQHGSRVPDTHTTEHTTTRAGSTTRAGGLWVPVRGRVQHHRGHTRRAVSRSPAASTTHGNGSPTC